MTKKKPHKNLHYKITLGIMQLVVGDSFSAAVLLEGYSVLFLMVVIFKIYQQQRLYSPKIGSSIGCA